MAKRAVNNLPQPPEGAKMVGSTAIALDIGQTFEGVYLGTREIKIGKRKQIMHRFEQSGNLEEMWGNAVLDARLTEVVPGTAVWICRDPDATAKKKGQNPAKMFRVAITAPASKSFAKKGRIADLLPPQPRK